MSGMSPATNFFRAFSVYFTACDQSSFPYIDWQRGIGLLLGVYLNTFTYRSAHLVQSFDPFDLCITLVEHVMIWVWVGVFFAVIQVWTFLPILPPSGPQNSHPDVGLGRFTRVAELVGEAFLSL